jgi:hypothetical protein
MQSAFLVGTHRYSFRPGEPARILGVVFVTRACDKARACYHVRFKDNREDDVPIEDATNFAIISEDDVVAERIPEVTH